MDYTQYLNQIYAKQEELNTLTLSYWKNYSSIGEWQFWVVAAFLVAPLILLYFTVDRKRIFELFFFGYTVHILWTYCVIALQQNGYFVHTYFLTPLLPNAFNIAASVLPVGFLLLYQYCIHKNKNFYLYTILLSAVFAFGFGTIEKYLGLIDFRKGTNQFHLFVIDIAIAYIAYWFTGFILKASGKSGGRNRELNINIMKQKAR